MLDNDLIADIGRADTIKQAAPDSAVTADAIFLALRLAQGRKARKTVSRDRASLPPEWFTESLQALRGQKLSIRQFMSLSGRVGASVDEARDVGRWLRGTGRMPYKCHGTLKFRI